MAVYGVLADIHGNLEALTSALAALDARGVTRILCLGDIVGYNADSDAVARLLRERGAECIAGNHDLIGIGRLGTGKCNDPTAYALLRTRRTLAADTRAFLGALPPSRVLEGRFVLVHGGVDDVEQYVRSAAAVRENAGRLARRFPGVPVCFFGHTHEQGVFVVDGLGAGVRQVAGVAEAQLAPGAVYFVNPGAVDAARRRATRADESPGAVRLAEFAVYDSEARRVEFHRAAYDHAASEGKAVAGGYRMTRARSRWMRLGRRVRSAAARLAAQVAHRP
jgi:predicted phosphodiesterase